MNPDFDNNFFLAKQLKSGDIKAYDYIMDSFYPGLCAYAYTLTKSHANAEDIVQNVFVQMWIKRNMIVPKLSIKSYLYKSVYNEFIDQYRKSKPVIYLEKKYIEALDLVVDNEFSNLDALMKILDAEINKLPPKCRNIFLLNKKEGLTHTEISEHLHISLKTVEGHITRAFRILEEKMGSKIKPIFFLAFDFRTEIINYTK
ncbi:MAG: RNA polymerase sigma-70 factor [Flavobacteriaceae bacterium]